jgi:tetratricopeptide (TPR) repeat protein
MHTSKPSVKSKSYIDPAPAQGSRTAIALELTRLVMFVACGLSFIEPAHGQQSTRDYFNVREAGDYYDYRSHPSYARPEQLLRTVERYHLGLSQQRMRERAYPQAFNEYEFILHQFPNHPQALLGMLELCKLAPQPKCMPTEFLERAIEVNPKAAGTYTVQGVYFTRIGKYPAAIDSYQIALSLQPDSANAHYNLGLAYFETKQYPLANEHAQKAYALGFPLPALREKLQREGQWKPIELQSQPAAARPANPEPGTPSSAGKSEAVAQPSESKSKKE